MKEWMPVVCVLLVIVGLISWMIWDNGKQTRCTVYYSPTFSVAVDGSAAVKIVGENYEIVQDKNKYIIPILGTKVDTGRNCKNAGVYD